MAEEKKTTLKEANELARTIFNSMPYEQRKRLGAPDDRLREINALIEKGDYLSMAHLKKRKKELEDWLIDWYKEICKKSLQVSETSKENDKSFTSLEEAAENYIAPIENDEGLDYINFNGRDIKDAFIAGAEWQKSEDDKETAELLAIAHLQGMEQQKEQMLKDAWEREVKIDSGGYPYIDITAELYDYKHDVPLAKEGELVKIIIVKED